MSAHNFDEVRFLFFSPENALVLGVSATLVLPLSSIKAEQDPLTLVDRVDRRIMALQFVQNPMDVGDDERTFRICLQCGAPMLHGTCVKCGGNMDPTLYAGLMAVPEKAARFVRDSHPEAFRIDSELVRTAQRNVLATMRAHSSPRSSVLT